MDAVTLRPEDSFQNLTHYLAIMSAMTRLKLAETDDQLRDVVSYLWTSRSASRKATCRWRKSACARRRRR